MRRKHLRSPRKEPKNEKDEDFVKQVGFGTG